MQRLHTTSTSGPTLHEAASKFVQSSKKFYAFCANRAAIRVEKGSEYMDLFHYLVRFLEFPFVDCSID